MMDNTIHKNVKFRAQFHVFVCNYIYFDFGVSNDVNAKEISN